MKIGAMTEQRESHGLSNPTLDGRVHVVQGVAAAWCALAGGIVLVAGWGFGLNSLKTILTGAAYMRVNTAIGLLLLGAALWGNRRWRRLAAAAGGLAAVMGILTVMEYACGLNLHVDELIVPDRMPPVPGWPPGRMAFATAVCFSLLGAGLALSALRRAISAIQWLALPAAVVSMTGLIGYLYGVNVYGSGSFMHMALLAALTFLVTSLALLISHPHRGAMRTVIGGGPGGWTARRLLPAAIVVPPLLGWLCWQGERLGYYDTACGVALFASANVIVFAALIWVNARALDHSDDRRTKAERDLRASEEKFRVVLESTPDAMIITSREGKMILVNAQAEALFGYRREELLGQPIEKLIPHDARARHRDHRAGYAAAPHVREMHRAPMDIRGLRKDGGEFSAGVSLNSVETPDGVLVVCAIRDLTVRELEEKTLRESEASFRQLADAMPQIVWTAGPDGNVEYHNRRWCDYTGLTPEQSRDWGWQPALHPDDLANCMKRRNRALAAGEAYEVEYRLRRAADLVYRWHLGRAVPVRNRGGAIVRWFGTCTDIDDYKRAEQEIRGAWLEIKSLNGILEQNVQERTLQLRDSEELFRSLVEGVKDYAILMLDPQGCVASWTESAERLMGYSRAEIMGRDFASFFTSADRECGHPDEILRAAALDGRSEEQGWRLRKDGSRYWAEALITAMREETGSLRGFSEIVRDITERKKSDEQIRQSEEQFRALLESAPDAVLIADSRGIIALVNAQAERIFGYGRQEMVGQPVEMLIPEEARTGHARQCEGYRGSGSARRMGVGMELNGLRKNGEEFPVEVSLSPIATANGSWVAAAIRDISERKLVERQLVIARQKAEEANRAKSAFLAAMSHEIRTPMNSILGMSDLLSETDLNDAQRQYVQIFRRAGANLLNLINDILDFSKIEAGHLELERTEFQLRELVDQAVELVAPKARGKGIALVSRCSPNVPSWFAGDSTRLRQVLINLLGNAIKFTETGEVVLTVQDPQPGSDDLLEFSVSDTGIGIPAEQLETVFEDFKQGDSSTTRKYGGSGLGLAISRGIVERMGGTISLASEIGKGSTFRFSARLQPIRERQEEAVIAVQDFHGHRVAIVDSSTTNRLILRETLAGWGIEAAEFASCEDTLADLAKMPPGRCRYSCIVIDSRIDRRIDSGMSATNGFETGARIRTIFPDLPLLMLSSDDRPGDEARSRESGFSGYAARPVSRTGLLQLISKSLERVRIEVAGPPGKSLRVLLAEDSPDNRLLVQLYLEGGPYALTFAEDGGQAVQQAANGEYDIILMDLQMPVMDGLAATRKIREMERERGGCAVPIVALSANARPEDVESSLEAGCTAHLSKPISKRRLRTALDGYARALPEILPAR
jgi:PAS domain S-box-containing protein